MFITSYVSSKISRASRSFADDLPTVFEFLSDASVAHYLANTIEPVAQITIVSSRNLCTYGRGSWSISCSKLCADFYGSYGGCCSDFRPFFLYHSWLSGKDGCRSGRFYIHCRYIGRGRPFFTARGCFFFVVPDVVPVPTNEPIFIDSRAQLSLLEDNVPDGILSAGSGAGSETYSADLDYN